MKPTAQNTGHHSRPSDTCGARRLDSCKRILQQVGATRAAIFAESRERLKAPERLLHLALNEAEALSWQTKYPHLVFPVLATEKVQALTHWTRRQRAIRRNDPTVVLSA